MRIKTTENIVKYTLCTGIEFLLPWMFLFLNCIIFWDVRGGRVGLSGLMIMLITVVHVLSWVYITTEPAETKRVKTQGLQELCGLLQDLEWNYQYELKYHPDKMTKEAKEIFIRVTNYRTLISNILIGEVIQEIPPSREFEAKILYTGYHSKPKSVVNEILKHTTGIAQVEIIEEREKGEERKS